MGGPAGHERASWLYAIARHIQKRERFLAVLETLDNGKPIRETRDIDVPLVARHFYHHAGWAEMLADEFPGQRPLGVCGQIIPWNFPLLMLAWKIAPGAGRGQYRGAETGRTDAADRACLRRDLRRGRPAAGVVNIVTGDGATGAALVGARGRQDRLHRLDRGRPRDPPRRPPARGKKLTLELGGKSPFIVFADADLDAAVEGVVDAIWFNQGQVCCAGSRILVRRGGRRPRSPPRLTRAAWPRCASATPWTSRTDIGAIVARRCSWRGSAIWWPRGRPRAPVLHAGRMPAARQGQLFTRRASDRCAAPPTSLGTEEIFGPVATLTTFRTPDEAVELANNTRYGLAASIWTENINLALDVAARVKAGVVWVNATNLFDAGAGFGGYARKRLRPRGRARGDGRIPRPPGPAGKARGGTGAARCRAGSAPAAKPAGAPIDRTAKLYIGGAQKRPDGGHSYAVTGPKGGIGLARPGQPQGYPQRRRGGAQGIAAGARRPGTTARRCSTTSPRTSRPAQPSSRRA